MEKDAKKIPAPGQMTMPADFKYKKVFQKGMPKHEQWDEFTVKHPPMPVARWAKIFSPFDALRGFSDLIKSQNT